MRVRGWLAAAALAVLPTAAHAFIGISPASAPAGTDITATFTVEHGCLGSPTVRLRIAMPQGVSAVKARDTPGWKASVAYASAADDAPVSEVLWIGGKLPNDIEGKFAITLKLPDAPDTTLYFPVTQDCEQGTYLWRDIPTSMPIPGSLHNPAPALTLTKR